MTKYYISAKLWTIQDKTVIWNDAMYVFDAEDIKSAMRQAELELGQTGKLYEIESIKVDLKKFPLAKKLKV